MAGSQLIHYRHASRRPASQIRRHCGAITVLLAGIAVCPPAAADISTDTRSLQQGIITRVAAQADAANEHARQPDAAVSINVSAAQAARNAHEEYGGRILNVTLNKDNEPPYYRVKLLRNGHVRVVHITAHE